MENRSFWMVLELSTGRTHVQHTSEDGAKTEARRLARVDPGKTFYVLKAITSIKVEIPIIEDDLEDIPF